MVTGIKANTILTLAPWVVQQQIGQIFFCHAVQGIKASAAVCTLGHSNRSQPNNIYLDSLCNSTKSPAPPSKQGRELILMKER